MQENTISRIDKSELKTIPFYSSEILTSDEDIKARRMELERAMILGNLYKQAVQIRFRTAAGEDMEIETTIWSVTEKNIVLKGGTYVPIHSISKVIL